MRFVWLAKLAAARPLVTLGIVVALAAAGVALALSLQPNASSDTFVSRSAASFKATDDDHRHFGADAVIVLVREPLPDLVQTSDLARVSELEACLGGQVLVANQQLQSFTPAPVGSRRPYGGYASPCGKLMSARPAQVVYGPGTFLNRAVDAVNREIRALTTSAAQGITAARQDAYKLALARGMSAKQATTVANAAATLKYQQELQQLGQLALDSGISGPVSIDDQQFISQVVFDPTRGAGQPKARFAYLFPTANSALIQVRLKASLTDAQQRRAIDWIREAVNMPMFALGHGGTYTVTGVPVVINDLASEITRSISGLLVAAVIVMALALLLVFRSRPRLLPLGIALAAVGITFGATSLLGASLTLASIAVLPILIGLGVDYAIQFQSRAQEAHEIGSATPAPAADGVARAAARSAPTIATAALATATGFLVLLLSPVPMVRGFGVLLVAGIAIALACALTAGSAALALADRDGGFVGASLRGASEILRGTLARVLAPLSSIRARRAARVSARLRNAPARLLAGAIRHPGRVLVVGVLLAVLGWVADTQTAVQSDVTKLVPPNMPALRDLRTLEQVTGVSGELDVTVHAADVATPRAIGWMLRYEDTLLTHYGYVETKGCAQATLCPALSLPDLFSSGQGAGQATPSASTIQALLNAVPGYFSQAVITSDRREATLAFGIRLMPLSRQQRVIDYMRSQLHPPAGITAHLAGLPVLAAEANSALSSSGRRLLTLLAGLAAVGLALLIVMRRPRRALVPLVPIVLATGWSALIVFLIGIPLNPMSATLGALVIAISTEFSVLLSERFRQERRAGYPLADALARTYGSTGRAVLASGITAIAGFGILVISSIAMLRDFGFVTLIDLSVSLAGVLLVLPSVLVLSEQSRPFAETARRRVRRAVSWLARPGRRARVA
ncbi:MAG: MMPL family transporter [Solirubrobacterales bacterium]|nr:MMPL family transporter [Solirubrobacterales bacterium]